MARQKSEREAIRRSQSHALRNSPRSLHTSRSQSQLQRDSHSSSSSRVVSSPLGLFRRSEGKGHARTSSAPESITVGLDRDQSPEWAHNIPASWVASEQQLPAAELEG